VWRVDRLNIVVEKWGEFTDPKTKAVRKGWKRLGYYGTLGSALTALRREFEAELAGDGELHRLDELLRIFQGLQDQLLEIKRFGGAKLGEGRRRVRTKVKRDAAPRLSA